MRKIIFRGKLKLDGVWVYWNEFGELTTKTGKARRQEIQYKAGQATFYTNVHQIKSLLDKDTIGQYLLRDAAKNPVFEGDILSDVVSGDRVLVFYSDDGVLCWKSDKGLSGVMYIDNVTHEVVGNRIMRVVIGNRFDNQDLLEGIVL